MISLGGLLGENKQLHAITSPFWYSVFSQGSPENYFGFFLIHQTIC